ncbi:hypothetical protein BACCIP111899_01988 [Bacillus rhizoplanae]|uniref:Uncharacterized protein n=1 Tax=Bacillus rhizoplanae TaxID=2880966 RepID=A0ABM8YAX8_9BACI|nr:hypothetical protein [Bacillus rhizoplanae]CAG9612810.1 hypothetical protein BACCIP111899_01988 [Bacillus rhizoplanae]
MKRGQIGVSHLVYIIIIFVIVLSFFLVIAFGGTDNAGTMMGTASTVSSLILSVIAIVLSLIDVAGQRESMVDLKETAEKLQESNIIASSIIESLTAKMDELQGMKDQMIKAVNKSEEWRTGLVKEIQGLKQMDDVKKEDLEGLYKKANEGVKSLDFDIWLEKNLVEQSFKDVGSTYSFIKYLREHFQENDQFKSSHFVSMIQRKCLLTHADAIIVFKDLVQNNYISLFMKKGDGESNIRLSNKLFEK